MTPLQPPLIDLLGARWTLGSAVLDLAWNGARAAFALADGTVALAAVPWAGAPALRPRPGGGVEVIPGRTPPPLTRAAVSRGPCLAVAPGGNGFLTGGTDGRLRRLSRDGTAERVAQFGGPVEAVVATGAGWACIAADAVQEGPTPGGRYTLPGAKGLAWHERAGLAVSHAGGIALCRAGQVEYLPGEAPGGVAPAFSLDRRWLAAGTSLWRLDPVMHVTLPGAPAGPARSAFSGDGTYLAVTGAECVQVWRLADTLALSDQRGRDVTALAWHPRRLLLAVAYGNGVVALGPPGEPGALLLRGASGEGVSAMAFESSGAWLAVGTAEGACEIIALPDLLFRDGGARAGTESEGAVA